MRGLSRDAAAFLHAGRVTFRPEPRDRDRVLGALARTLGTAVFLEDGSPGGSGAASHWGLSWKTWGLTGLSVLALCVGGRALRHGAAQAPTVQAPRTPTGEEVRGARTTASAARVEEPARDPMTEELRLLGLAEQQIRAGQPDGALRTLAEHEAQFPNGELAEERLAARAHALALLGRAREAELVIDELARADPGSPYLQAPRGSWAAGDGTHE